MKCTADMSDAFAISLPDERWKSRCFYCLATYKKDNFSWFSVFFIISKWFKLLFLLLLPSSSSCPAWRKPVAHWGNWPEDFSCPSQILHAPGNRTPVSFEPCPSSATLHTQYLNKVNSLNLGYHSAVKSDCPGERRPEKDCCWCYWLKSKSSLEFWNVVLGSNFTWMIRFHDQTLSNSSYYFSFEIMVWYTCSTTQM